MGCLFELCKKRRDDYIDQKTLKIHICGKIDEPKVKEVFPEPCELKFKGKNIGDWQWKTDQFTWIAKLYKGKDNIKNFDSIFEEIKKDSDNNIIKNHIVLSFGDENNEELFESLYEVGTVYLPRFIFITKKEGDYSLKKKSYITNIIYTDLTDVELITNIKSELWEIDCYYNERGNEKCTFLPNQIIENLEISDMSINILLTGISRSGKSTFINTVNNSLLSLENCEKSSVTSKITEYKIYFGQKKSEKDGYLKFIDTAGINFQTNKKSERGELTDLPKINKSIYDLIEKYKKKTPLENIHFVLFFFIEGTPLEGVENILKMFLKENYKVLFIINKSSNDEDNGQTTDIKSTLKFLKKNGLGDLAVKENIIPCNIVNSEKANGYGINTIFKRIFEILKAKNRFYNDIDLLNKLKKLDENRSENLNAEEREKETNKLKEKITKENELFKEYVSEIIIMNKAEEKANFDTKIYKGITTSQAFIPIPYSDLALTPAIQAKLVHTIFSDFGMSLTEINWEAFGNYLLGGGLREISHYGYNKASKAIFEKTAKGCLVQLGKMLMNQETGKTVVESMKFVPFLGFFAGAGIGMAMNYFSTQQIADRTIIFCKKYLTEREKGMIGFFVKNFEIYNNIFTSIENLSKKENWWDYKVKIIKKKQEKKDE